MRRLLLSTAALLLLAAPALADPPSDRGGNRGEHSNRAGKASVAPQAQERAQAQLRAQPQPQQIQRQGNGPGRGNERHDDNRVGGNPAQSAVLENRGNGDRGNFRDDRGRDNRDRGRIENRDNGNGRVQGINPRPAFNRDLNRDGRTGYRAPNFGGPRHDFSGFRDYHRTFHAPRRFRADFYRRPAGWYEHRWIYGEFLPAAFWARDYWIIDFQEYDLPPPPYGAVWVRVGSDALMIDEDSGEVITVAYDVFY
jgi:Ni/Co efflux regulator RcnB